MPDELHAISAAKDDGASVSAARGSGDEVYIVAIIDAVGYTFDNGDMCVVDISAEKSVPFGAKYAFDGGLSAIVELEAWARVDSVIGLQIARGASESFCLLRGRGEGFSNDRCSLPSSSSSNPPMSRNFIHISSSSRSVAVRVGGVSSRRIQAASLSASSSGSLCCIWRASWVFSIRFTPLGPESCSGLALSRADELA